MTHPQTREELQAENKRLKARLEDLETACCFLNETLGEFLHLHHSIEACRSVKWQERLFDANSRAVNTISFFKKCLPVSQNSWAKYIDCRVAARAELGDG